MTRRPAARRRPLGRRSRSRKRRQADLAVLAVLAVVSLVVVVAAVRWVAAHWWVLVVVPAVVAAAGAGWLHLRGQAERWRRVRGQALRYLLSQLDALHHRDFEYAVRDLLERDGCRDAVRVGGANDRGADVIATDPLGRRWVIQCKHRKGGLAGKPVGTPDLQVLNGTARQLHGADVAVLLTNGRYTKGCPPLAKSQRLHLVDRRTLGEWAAGSQPLWELLHRLPPPRKASKLS